MKIEFVPGTKNIENFVPAPEPSKNFIPDWYKKIPGGSEIINVKQCIPFLDSLSQGYIQKTWCDIKVELKNNQIQVGYDNIVAPFNFRNNSDMPFSDTCYPIEFTWQRPWSVILPENFSAVVVHPLNRYDLPFITLSGVVDFDRSIHAPIGNIPFYIKNNFIGTIPKGTPMFQIIPIKRESWTSSKHQYSEEFWESKQKERDKINGFYKKKIWTRKSFD